MTQVELQKQNDELSKQTVTDALTGAYNRAHFNQELARLAAQVEQSPLGILFIDGDRFKSVNDTHGHASGDAVLKELTTRIQRAVGASGTVCRYGGEEFAVLLGGCDLSGATKMGESVRRAVDASHFELSKYDAALPTLKVTISVGVSALEPKMSGVTGAQVTAAADAGVYAAKKSGRNRVCVCRVGSVPMNLDGSPVMAEDGATGHAGPGQAPGVPAVAQTVGGSSATANPSQAVKAELKAGGAAAGATAKQTILVVEDDPLAAKLMELLFGKRADLQVHVVESGEDAMQYLTSPSKPRPVAIIADMNLPGITGINLAMMVANKLGKDAPPVVIVTSASDERAKNLAKQGGVALFLNKGDLCTNFEQAFAQIKRVLTHHASVQQLAA